jgi:hypothetical protein
MFLSRTGWHRAKYETEDVHSAKNRTNSWLDVQTHFFVQVYFVVRASRVNQR